MTEKSEQTKRLGRILVNANDIQTDAEMEQALAMSRSADATERSATAQERIADELKSINRKFTCCVEHSQKLPMGE